MSEAYELTFSSVPFKLVAQPSLSQAISLASEQISIFFSKNSLYSLILYINFVLKVTASILSIHVASISAYIDEAGVDVVRAFDATYRLQINPTRLDYRHRKT